MRNYSGDWYSGDWWAKIDEENYYWHPVVAHAADVAAVMEQLYKKTVLGERFEQLISGELTPRRQARLLVLAAYHDVGKVSKPFQEGEGGHQVPVLSCLGGCLMEPLQLEAFRPWFERPTEWFYATWGHHGEPVDRDVNLRAEDHWPEASLTKAKEFPQHARQWFPAAFSGGEPVSSRRAQHLFNGILTLSDWIASDTRFFPYRRWHDWEEPKDLTDPLAAMQVAKERARRAVQSLSLSSGVSEGHIDHSWSQILGGHKPYDVQAQMGGLANASAGTLTILESPTGSGKTEGAYRRFLELLAEGYVDSLYFALPTRSAAKQLQIRLTNMRNRTLPSDAHVHLATPGYTRVDDVQETEVERWGELGEGTWASESSKRYTSAPLAVGTVDQALLSCLRNRHAHLRGAGLLRSLLVVDEVHASDTYMEQLLKRVLDLHLSAGGHAVLMSATLGSSARSVYTGEETPGFGEAKGEEYPLVTHVSGSDVKSYSAGIPDEEDKTVYVPTDRIITQPDVVAQRAEDAARSGAHVLVIRNTVREARKTFKAISKDLSFRVAGLPCPHHSRYAAADRRLMDRRIEREYGKGSERSPQQGLVTVATQTVEQSLDIDADFIISDLCPMDVLLQRIGRLHRHSRSGRPSGYWSPRCLVAVPDYDLASRITESGQAWADAGIGSVYQDLRILQATQKVLGSREEIEIPADNRELVESATHPEVLTGLESDPRFEAHARHLEEGQRSLRQSADFGRLDWDEPYREQGFPDERISTRPGFEPISVELPEAVETPFGNETEMITLSYYMFDEPEDIDFEDQRVKHLAETESGFEFEFAGQQFHYQSTGLSQNEST
ncbi:CRISPR-associated helicase Cas3' [Salinibacter ruber]|uniref:CRISPR-associated endonuclease/helicase Cas3 n=1 Tax=Salinibacter ruber TaxID=146919 RepID=A0A9X2ZEI4_9BACT|nr:CRISPR-associated helicase Cas3' [Salinibacter ruber]MCS4038034.1 CRISPR-associated endonuclease/helicase Cas3 [Salinibacter ruber]